MLGASRSRAPGLFEHAFVAGHGLDVHPWALVPEMVDGRGVADREAAHAGVLEPEPQLLVLPAVAEALVVPADAHDVGQPARRVPSLPGSAPRLNSIEH